jgi:hypothetical protein
MPTRTTFPVKANAPALPAISNSVGAHIASKLEAFASDERTLTDELCDMLCLWATRTPLQGGAATIVNLVINKISQNLESTVGADLEILLLSPPGAKRLLAQAKVLDPGTMNLRVIGKASWGDLRIKLAKCRQRAPGLAYLMLYVPKGQLNGSKYAFHVGAGLCQGGYWSRRALGSLAYCCR